MLGEYLLPVLAEDEEDGGEEEEDGHGEGPDHDPDVGLALVRLLTTDSLRESWCKVQKVSCFL
jgi:hypothetical protein